MTTLTRASDVQPLFGRADLQVHSAAGDGMCDARAIFDRIERLGLLEVVAITDHDSVRGALEAREQHARGGYHFDLVTGIEVTTRSGHLLALWVDEPIRPLRPLDETIAAIHRAGGLAVVPHPLSYLTRSVGRRALERVLAQDDPETRPDGIELANQSVAGRVTAARARRLNAGYGLAETGGSDAHFLEHVGSSYTLFCGRSAAELRHAISERATRGVDGPAVPLGAIGWRRIAQQQVRGLSVTPRQLAGNALRHMRSRSTSWKMRR